MASNFFTAFHRALQDDLSYFSFQKEMNLKAVEQVFFNSLAGKGTFDAVVLPESLNQTNYLPNSKVLRVRPLGIHDFIIPEPCAYAGCHEKVLKIIHLHPVAYPDSNIPLLPGSQEKADTSFAAGEVVECFFLDGPQNTGNLRGLRYRKKKNRISNLTPINCITGQDLTMANVFNKGGYVQKGLVYPEKENSNYRIQNPQEFTEEQRNYITSSKITDNKTSDGATHIPTSKTYHGVVESFKGKRVNNGLLPIEILGVSKEAKGYHRLFLIDVVHDFERLAISFKKRFGQDLTINDSYRTFQRQIDLKNKKISENNPEEAAKPGTSNHGWGLAFDFSTYYNRKSSFYSETYKWMLENAPKFGFENPKVLRDGKGPEEAWHIQWIKINEIFK